MKENNQTGLVPFQKEGQQITAEATIEFPNVEQAATFYKKARERLLCVQNWRKIAGALSAELQLTDDKGNIVNRATKEGDHFRIDILGPGSDAGQGYDWARIEAIKEVNTDEIDSIAILVRPASDPNTSNPNVAHFFADKSTSTFVVTRKNEKVEANVYDRNIEANEETRQPLDKFRNAVVGLAAKHGVSKLQWQALVDGFIKKD